ncbi:hypothetical protein D9611_008345 [Ephemerocybe angulata]|uniref:Uncharacterized protein n=1 Tax=Ephemerocybe angulata TaxID=980116 RepID=A0A8H5F5K2_9AGAR|nr:hypothetical protein D9611_008345 [Tulosesus angulatus]
MSSGSCKLPGNPDIAGVGVRIAIYIQNLLCFIPAFWALADGKVTRGELEAAETQATTNLVLAFAILISSIVQAQTLGLTNYHASIVLNMSWMNNTNAFIYFLLYVQYKSQGSNPRRVPPTWSAWARDIRGLAVSVIPGTNRGRPGHDSTDPEGGKSNDGVASSVYDAQIDGDNDSRRGAKILVKRFVLLLGSLHLTLMAGLGLWLWSDIRAFGEGQDASNECAAKHALVAILGSHVPFASEALRIASLFVYAIFLTPGINLLLPIALFLGLYSFWRVLPIPKVLAPGEVSVGSPFHYAWLRLSIRRRVCNSIARRWSMLPPFIGLVFLLAVNLVFIIDIELALKQNDGLQDREEAVWGFGQILAMLLLFMPLRDLTETILARRTKKRQKDLDMGLGGAINAGNQSMVITWLARGANPNAKLEDIEEISTMHMACTREDLDIIRILLEAGADPNIEGGQRRDPYTIDRDNKDSLRLLNQVEMGTLDPVKALVQAAKNGYGAAIKVLLGFMKIKPDEKESFLEVFSKIKVHAGNTDEVASPATAVTKVQEFETVILKLLFAAPGIDVNAPDTKFYGRSLLTSASQKGHKAIVKLLLASPGIDVNLPDIDGRTPLSLAARYGHEAIVKLLLAVPGINVNTADVQGRTPLSFAAETKHETVFKLLLAATGIDVNAPDTSGRTPLTYATWNGHEAVVRLLLTVPGIDVNESNAGGQTPLSLAAGRGHKAVVELLLAAPGINVNTADVQGRTPLSFAAETRHETVFKLLLAATGIDVNAPDTDGRTPLTYATWNGHEAVLNLLLATPGIDINTPDIDGWTALMYAAWNGYEAVLRHVLAAPGINVNAANTSAQTSLMYAASNGNDAVLKLLLSAPGIDVSMRDINGRVALSFAAANGCEAALKHLLAAPGIDVNALDTSRWTPLMHATMYGHEPVLNLLLATPGIDVNVADSDGWTALIFAASYGHIGAAELLLAVPGIDVNIPDTDGWTPLIFVAMNGYRSILNLLLATPGINVGAEDTNGWTALIWAAFKGNKGLVNDLAAAPGITGNLADLRRHLEHPPNGWQWYSPASKDAQGKCIRILEMRFKSECSSAPEDASAIPDGIQERRDNL